MIIVTPNYRVNIFGSLRTSVSGSKINGNQCLQDQRQAFKFVNRVISNFGGDKTRVAIGGQSAGAQSVLFHYTAPGSWQYFNRAIAISPPISFIPPSKKMAQDLGDYVMIKLGCSLTNATAQFDCLLSKSSDEVWALGENSSTMYFPTPNEFMSDNMKWSPAVDAMENDPLAATIPELPLTQVQNGKFNKNAPLYIGTVTNETIAFLQNLPLQPEMIELFLAYSLDSLTIAKEVIELYGPIPSSKQSPTSKYTPHQEAVLYTSRILSDFAFHCPIFKMADMVSDSGVDTWVYVFDEIENWAKWWNNNSLSGQFPVHVDDVASFWYNPKAMADNLYANGCPPLSNEQVLLNKYMQKTWGQFVHDGKINQTSTGWPQYNSATRLMNNLSTPLPTNTISNFRGEFCQFWTNKVGYNRR